MLNLLTVMVLSYLVGSIPTGYVSVCAVAAAFALPPAYLFAVRVTPSDFDPVVFGFFVFAFFLTLFGVRKKLLLYLRGEAELFHRVMVLRRRKGG